MYTNIDSISNKMDELNAKIAELNPDVIGLTEVKPKNTCYQLSAQELNIDGYTAFVNLSGRGVALYVKDYYGAVDFKPKQEADAAVWCTVKISGTETMIIGVVYRSPNSSEQQNRSLESNIRSAADGVFHYFLLMGDFNFPEINWNSFRVNAADNHPAESFLNCIQDLFLHQHVLEPTHHRHGQTANTLDLIFTNGEELVSDLLYNETIGKSHHSTLTWTTTCYLQRTVTSTVKHCYNKGDFDGMRKLLSIVDWDGKLNELSLEEMWFEIKDSILEAVRKCIPIITFNDQKASRRRKPVWMNDRAMAALRRKKKAYDRYLRSREGMDYIEYVKLRNTAKSEVRNAVRNYEKDIASKAKKNPKAFYRYVNSKIKGRGAIPDLRNSNGSVINENLDKANAFNKFFSSVFTKEDIAELPQLPNKGVKQQLTDVSFTCEDVLKLLQDLKPDKSPGPDMIHPRVLKECAHELAYPLFRLFRKSLDEGNVPKDWKSGNVTPIHKKGSRTSVDNYRPVSLTSVICKVIEKLLRKPLLDHMFDNDFISDCQHGFIPGRSCTTQLLEVLDKWTDILDSGGAMDVIYLDLAKAFDSVPHRRLLLKLQSYGINGIYLRWISNFLLGRSQRVMVAGTGSEWAPVLSGVPQGSVLGPVLFICYINDMPNTVSSFIYMYADDTKIGRQVATAEDSKKLQADLNRMQQWSDKWQLKFNSTKCKVMHLGYDNSKATYTMINDRVEVPLEHSSEEKDLGVWTDNKLKFAGHVGHIVAKGGQLLGLIKRSFVHRDVDIIKTLYTALVRPHLEYANVVWHPRYKKEVEQLERVQRRATKLVCNLRHVPYESRLRQMELPSLVYRRYRGDMIEVFKYLRGMYSVRSTELLPRASVSALRGHDYKLMKRHCRSHVRLTFFSFRVVTLWNNLPSEVVSAPSLNTFKGRLDKYWGHHCYSLDPSVFVRRQPVNSQQVTLA